MPFLFLVFKYCSLCPHPWQHTCILIFIEQPKMYVMKQLIIGACMLCFAHLASAQTTGSNSGKSTANSSAKVTKKTTAKKIKKSTIKKKAPLNNRKEYEWKNGQQATPTGHEATGINGGYSAIKKDTINKSPAKKRDQ
jgi:hypothetical protein